MLNLRYLFLILLVVLLAASFVLWEGDEAPIISFTRPANDTDEDTSREPEQPISTLTNSAMVPRDEALNSSSSLSQTIANSRKGRLIEEPLTEQQLAEQIKLAQEKFLRVAALNERKQAQVNKIIAEGGNAEQSLIEAELAYRIGGWRHAWRTGDTQSYFDFYSEQFKPRDDKNLAQWKAQRVKRLNLSQPIDLTLEDFEVSFDPETKRSLVTFKQFYKSGNYQDTIKKRLVMAKEQGQWKIVSEIAQ